MYVLGVGVTTGGRASSSYMYWGVVGDFFMFGDHGLWEESPHHVCRVTICVVES